MERLKPDAWLPTTKKEVEARGWDELDVILFSGDAYIDHPSFGAAVIGRVLESQGLRIAIVPQPDWRGDFRDFTKLGKPNLFFGVAPGAMDSMINHYTAGKRLRSDDAYTPDNKSGMRPDYPTVVYTKILKQLFPDVPVVLGGIEASLRRLAHYDYWQDRLRPGILADSPADLLIYGMGEKPVIELVKLLQKGVPFHKITNLPQTGFLTSQITNPSETDITLYSFEECLKDKIKQAENFKIIEEESNKIIASRILQKTNNQIITVNPPYPTASTAEVDSWYDLPYTRLPHPKYKNRVIPAYEMIRHSVSIHRGCFGGCAFCTISAHQGKQIVSRSEQSVLKEVKKVTEMPDFKGYISDLGGPSANMYKMSGKDMSVCQKCKKPSCIFPKVCPILSTDHRPLSALYEQAKKVPGIKKIFVGSGVRYDLLLHRDKDEVINTGNRKYLETLLKDHVSGRLKVAPEHTEDKVLQLMRKPSFSLFEQFKKEFDRVNSDNNLNQQLIPYFISSHPACTELDMAELAVKTKNMNYQLEQVQDFTPSPMTLATEIFYTGVNPYKTSEKIHSAQTKPEKQFQRSFFFWYLDENRKKITQFLRRLNRNDLINKLFSKNS
ncbi:MAG: YgiQ family radical SAM protein [Tannerella sp.]|nr:YgiQ family radical SAM protein [Tannerella sp.]